MAFCISRKKDTETWQRFFRHVRDVVGVIQPAFFLSDGDFTYYNAWTAVMAKPGQQRLCLRHVKKTWADAEEAQVRREERQVPPDARV